MRTSCGNAAAAVLEHDGDHHGVAVGRFGEEPLITRSSTSTLQQEFLRWSKQYIPQIRPKQNPIPPSTPSSGTNTPRY